MKADKEKTSEKHTAKAVLDFLREVADPEIPVLNIVELGIVREVKEDAGILNIVITPTYSGCPAMKAIEEDIGSLLSKKGIGKFRISTTLSPAWTTDWITDEAKKKLMVYGIAPPEKPENRKGNIPGKPDKCPNCGSKNTKLKSEFGSTACKALYVCGDCLEPFEYFKCY